MAVHGQPPAGDPLLERLERLQGRQGRAPVGQTFPPPTTTPTRRRHPARGARIGALLASCATTGGLAYFFAGTNTSQASAPIPGLAAPIAATAATSTTIASPSTTTAIAPTAATATTVAAADAVVAFDGDTIQTKFGPVQVQAQIQNGILVAVAIIQYPDGDGKSVRINQRALPELQSEALTAQSAEVDTVSGATYTSNAYAKSLQSAIDEARAAGAITA
jgi:uncharacterized protein with FMN-binding domain